MAALVTGWDYGISNGVLGKEARLTGRIEELKGDSMGRLGRCELPSVLGKGLTR